MAPSVSSSRATSFACPLAFDGLRQQPLKQGKRLQRLAQVMAGGGEEARLGGIGQLRLPLGCLQRVRRVPPVGDIGKGDDDALDAVVLSAIRQDAADVPGAVLSFDLPLDRRKGAQHRAGIGQQRGIGSQRAEVGKRPPDVARE